MAAIGMATTIRAMTETPALERSEAVRREAFDAATAIERSRTLGIGPSNRTPTNHSPLQQRMHSRKRSSSLLGPGGAASAQSPTTPAMQRARMASKSPFSSASSSSSGHSGTDALGNPHNADPNTEPVSRFATNVTDFHLPQRYSIATISSTAATNASAAATAMASNASTSMSTSPAAMRVEGDFGLTSTTLPLLRRAAAAAAFASANRVRLRRGSMLGREVRKDAELTSSDEDEEMNSVDEDRNATTSDKSPSPSGTHGPFARRSGNRSSRGSEREEEDMHIETGDVSLENVQLDSRSRPSTPPPSNAQPPPSASNSPGLTFDGQINPFALQMRGTAGRRGLARNRGQQGGARDRGVQRVAASLRDEARPSDSEIASEARLQRKLAPESESITPNTPRLMAINAARSPTTSKRLHGPHSTAGLGVAMAGSGNGGMERNHYNDDDDMLDHFDPYDDLDSSDEEEGMTGKGVGGNIANGFTASTNTMTRAQSIAAAELARTEEMGTGELGDHVRAIAIPEPSPSQQRERLWLDFRDVTPLSAARASPGAERVLGRGRPRTASGSTAAAMASSTAHLSTSLGSPSLDTTMEMDHHGGPIGFPASARANMTMASPGLWGKSGKRKHDTERYEPYSTSLHKRRAVSPVTVIAATAPVSGFSGSGQGAAAAAAHKAAVAVARYRARSSTPTATGQSPLLQAVMAPQQSSPLLSIQTAMGNHAGMTLPMPTPLSIPSPTLSVTRSMGGAGPFGAAAVARVHRASYGGAGEGEGMGGVEETSHGTRPSTPTTTTHPGSANASPWFLSNSAAYGPASAKGMHAASFGVHGGLGTGGGTAVHPGTASTASNGGGGAGSSTVGSGPGYGSGALGLSLGSGGGSSRRFKQEQEEQAAQEDMLDDVSAIQLGEM